MKLVENRLMANGKMPVLQTMVVSHSYKELMMEEHDQQLMAELVLALVLLVSKVVALKQKTRHVVYLKTRKAHKLWD